MSNEFTIEIITPENQVIKSDASEVIIPSYEGEMGILKDHIPLITFLRPGVIVIKGKEEKKFYVEEGTVEFSENNLELVVVHFFGNEVNPCHLRLLLNFFHHCYLILLIV